jgi:erythromycin esterase-like protein
MKSLTTKIAHSELGQAVHAVGSNEQDWDELVDYLGEARFVLLGEASHGTHEFYRRRAQITKRLIVEKGFHAVAIEADWPDTYRLHRYVTGRSRDVTALEALADFARFPLWMWRNAEMIGFVAWLHAHNGGLPSNRRPVGLYGLDLYSLHASIDAVLKFLEPLDPRAAARARERYACFDHVGKSSGAEIPAGLGLSAGCEQEAVAQLVELRNLAAQNLPDDGLSPDDLFFAEQNARLIKNADRYYSTMLHETSSWNVRDRHMAETLDELVGHLARSTARPKVVVWEHNSHLGDARATEMGQAGELNVGQLVRERYGTDTRLVGFTTYRGTVTAASSWGAEAECKTVVPALPESYEALFHQLGLPAWYLTMNDPAAEQVLGERRLERAIGVVYRPETERASHYFYACLPRQFDAVVHVDETQAVRPLDHSAGWMGGVEVPDTYPSGV